MAAWAWSWSITASLVRPREQVPEGRTRQVGQPPAPEVLGLVVQHMTSLAQGGQVRGLVVRWVMIAVAGRQHHAGMCVLARMMLWGGLR